MATGLRFPVSADPSLDKKGNCLGCGLLRGDPLGDLLARTNKPDSRVSQEIMLTLQNWKDGAELGCVLCRLVEEVTQDIDRRHDRGRAAEVQLLAGPYRNDMPYYIRLTASNLDADRNRYNVWEIELFVTKGMTSQLLQHSHTTRLESGHRYT
jgi:hypothetical protein